MSASLDKDRIPTPRVYLTPRALSELTLMMENDFTLGGKYFRIVISGKGCEGFTYATGLTDMKEDDFEIQAILPEDSASEEFIVLMDPFAAFYLQECSVDFIQDLEKDLEGFVVTNHAQEKYAGKFWREDESKVPPIKDGASA